MLKELVCISCPNGCRLKLELENGIHVTGAKCEKGREYAENELLHPVRVVTSTAHISGAGHSLLPVRTDKAISRDKVMQVIELMHGLHVTSPVLTGDVVVADILGTDVNIIACKDM